ncbi:hypothetical protein C7212DRAFT_303292 [Tuber magnatum]|uniref:Splicing factor Cactin n=1 Tax=Tuber magnatum TaxID=42249 RepID=A0A317SCD9_9PEZI|nr:hypothetical protein C7212DRAFT_303292 [Tuber magnatum]
MSTSNRHPSRREMPYREREPDHSSRKRTRSPEPDLNPPWRKQHQSKKRTSPPQRAESSAASASSGGDNHLERRKQERHVREQTRLNALQEDEQMREWVNQEDTFVLKQAKKKAEIRVKEGRAKPIDWLAVNLRVIDKDRSPLDDEIADEDLDVIDPVSILDGLDEKQLEELETEIDAYILLETNGNNREYWATMKIICRDRRDKSKESAPEGRAVSSVAGDVDKLFSSKSLEELQTLEAQIVRKLNSNEPIDVDYWNELLRSLRVWKAKASLKKIYGDVIKSRLEILVRQQKEEAKTVRAKLEAILSGPKGVPEGLQSEDEKKNVVYKESRVVPYTTEMDPEPMLRLRHEEKGLESADEKAFLEHLEEERQKVRKMGYVPVKARQQYKAPYKKRFFWQKRALPKAPAPNAPPTSRFAAVFDNDDFSQATKALYEREVARGVGDNEEIFTGEEEVTTTGPKPAWASKYRPRKPRYFNRVQMGYEWNKYNQTHYDHDNPPPRVVQGYKFNIFYPDLIDKTKAPTYRIEREGGRKRGQSFAPAGEEDTCLIRFIAGPPYEDLAFRIVDKEWDYSAKRERGFRSSFDKGILQLHFQLKKIYYRK